MKRKFSEYPDSDIFESAVIVKLFNSSKMREHHLERIPSALFLDPKKRAVVFAMKVLTNRNIEITYTNLAFFLINPDELTKAFIKKHHVGSIDEVVISDLVYNADMDCDDELFEESLEEVRRYAWCRFVEDKTQDIKYYNDYGFKEYHSRILASSKAIIHSHEAIYQVKNESEQDQLKKAMHLINSADEHIPTHSKLLNSYIGGFTRGYVHSVIAKSGHNKSTWTDYNTVYSIYKDRVPNADIITPEESAETRWRRVIAMLNNIPTSQMRAKTVKVTQEHLNKVEQILKGRLRIHDKYYKYNDVMELILSLRDSGMIVIDHINSIDYPGNKGSMSNMINNIPQLISICKKVAKERNIPIIVVSQVNDKEIQRSERMIKAPRYSDAYGSSILYQAAREYLALWYPIKDYEENPITISSHEPTMNEFWVYIEKSSFSRTGKIELNYNPEYAKFSDTREIKQTKNLDYEAPPEESLFSEKK